MLWGRFSSVIYFILSSVYVSAPVSQLIPSPASSLVNIRLLPTSVTLLPFYKQVHLDLFFFLDSKENTFNGGISGSVSSQCSLIRVYRVPAQVYSPEIDLEKFKWILSLFLGRNF